MRDALARISAPVLTVSIDSDILSPRYQQEAIHAGIVNGDPRNEHTVIHSVEGHDGFLLEVNAVSERIAGFLAATDDV